jgi:hypothetical protein
MHSEGSARRIPAAKIESAVVDQLRAILRAPEIIVTTWRAARPSMDGIPVARHVNNAMVKAIAVGAI